MAKRKKKKKSKKIKSISHAHHLKHSCLCSQSLIPILWPHVYHRWVTVNREGHGQWDGRWAARIVACEQLLPQPTVLHTLFSMRSTPWKKVATHKFDFFASAPGISLLTPMKRINTLCPEQLSFWHENPEGLPKLECIDCWHINIFKQRIKHLECEAYSWINACSIMSENGNKS